MPPTLALVLWLILLVGLFLFDPAKDSGRSWTLWVPLIWMFIVGSRLPSQWFRFQGVAVAQALEEGNPLDRSVSLLLIVLAVGILLLRSFNWGGFLGRNLALLAFLSFALVSVLWSDFPFVSFKRWFRDLGNYLVILVVLSDTRPTEAARTLLRRLAYLLIPLSILLVKYFPAMARQYEVWSGTAMYVGATTSKNMLGAVCMISGIFFFWDTMIRWPDRKERRSKRIIQLNAAFLAMTLWLLHLSNSATSSVCMVIGLLVVVLILSKWGKRHPTLVRVMIPVIFCVYLILAFAFDLNGKMASQLGRDPTLTDRTVIWNVVLSLHTNPLIGTGYESFWLGPRLEKVWQVAGPINEAHNGYLDVYLNLGIIGLILLIGLLMSSYWTIYKRLSQSSAIASLNLAMWTVILFYNVTEVAFKVGVLWLILLLGAIVIPTRAENKVPNVAVGSSAGATRRFSRSLLGTASQRR